MPLKLYQRKTGFFHIRGTHHGIRVDRSARTRDRVEAEQVREALERRIFDVQIHGKKPKHSFAQAVVGYIRSGGEGRYLPRIIAMIGETPLSDVRQGLIDHVAATLYPGAKSSTVNRQVHTPISAVLNWAVDEGWAEPRRVRRPRQPAGRVDWRTPEEIEALIRAAEEPLSRLITFYVGTGARASEGLLLEWRDVSPEARRVTLWETKGGYSRHVDLQERVRAFLPPREGRYVWPWWSAYDSVNQALRRLCKREGLPPISCHVFRHTWATWRYAVTRDIDGLMKAGGWRSVALAMRYVHAGTDDLAAAVKALGWEFDGSAESPKRERAVK